MIILLIGIAAVFATGIFYQAFGRIRDRHRYRPPGRVISCGRNRLHLLDSGSGRPTVVLESGIAGTLLGWGLVQPAVSKFTRVCSYDRAGLGWSKSSTLPRTVENMTEELAALLRKAEIPPPYILVGHSFGALLVRAYAHRRPGEVAGLVLVDPVGIASWAHCSDEQRRRLKLGVSLSNRGAILARLGVVRAALGLLAAGGRWLPQLVSRVSAGQGTSVIERLIGEVRLLPPETAPMVRSHWSNPKCFQGMASYLECLPKSAATVLSMAIPPSIPVTVLSAGDATPEEFDEREAWVEHSIHGQHVRVTDSGHWIQTRRPDAVLDAIRDLVDHFNGKH